MNEGPPEFGGVSTIVAPDVQELSIAAPEVIEKKWYAVNAVGSGMILLV